MSKPMAIVTVGGLVYGTLLTLVVVPCIYDMFQREKRQKVSDPSKIDKKSDGAV